jgi:hypothetical protein
VTDSRNGWDEYRQLVLHELGRLSEQMAGIRDEIHTSERKVMVALEKLEREYRDTRDEVLRLKTITAIIAAVAGAAASFLTKYLNA